MKRFLNKKLSLLAVMALTAFSTLTHALLYEDKPDVTTLDSWQDFETVVMQSDSFWLVQFCNPQQYPTECEALEEDFSKVASLMKGLIPLAFVNVATDGGKDIAEYHPSVKPSSIIGPALYWFLDDKPKAQKVAVEPTELSLEHLIGHTMKIMGEAVSARAQTMGLGMKVESDGEAEQRRQEQEKDQQKSKQRNKKDKPKNKVVHVTGDEEFENKVLLDPRVTMVAFTAPWCGHCKMLQPEWEEAAGKLDGHDAQVVWIDATDAANQQLAHTFGVKGYPTIVTFPGGAPKTTGTAKQYPGERKARAMVEYILGEVDRTGVPKEIPELTSATVLKDECKGHNHICVVAALPHILDSSASGRNQYRDLLAKVAKTFRGSAFSFLWFQGGDQPEFESAMQLTFGFPAMVAYSMDRNAFAVMHGSFSEKGMTSFLHGVTSGRVPVGKLAKEEVPKIESTEPWDEQDAAPPEEEFDLADIMGWDDEEEEGGGSNEGASNEGGSNEGEL